MNAQMFGDAGLLDDSVEAKRRRIARVCYALFMVDDGMGGGAGCGGRGSWVESMDDEGVYVLIRPVCS